MPLPDLSALTLAELRAWEAALRAAIAAAEESGGGGGEPHRRRGRPVGRPVLPLRARGVMP